MSSSNLPPLPLIDGCLFVDNSGWIESTSTCNRQTQYKNLNKRILVGERAALNFGSAIHLGLEYRYVKYQNKAVDEQYYNDVSSMLTEFFSQHPTPLDDWRTLNWAMTMLRKYNERYPGEEFSLLQYNEPQKCAYCGGKGTTVKDVVPIVCLWCNKTGLRTVMVELPFALPLFVWKSQSGIVEIPIIYTGKIDLPISVDNQTFILDHKTTGMLGTSFFDGKRMSSQQRGYCWAFETLTKQKISGYIVNAIRTKEPPQWVKEGKSEGGKKKQSPEQWWQESLQRERYILKPGDLDEWKQNTISLIEEFLWHYSRGYIPMRTGNEHACVNYGKCQYFDVCRLAIEDRDSWLNSGAYTENTWSPLNKK